MRLRPDMVYAWALAILARACVEHGATHHARPIYRALAPYAGRVAVAAGAVMCAGSVDRYLAGLAALRVSRRPRPRRGADRLARGQEPEHGTGQVLLVLSHAGNGRGERRIDNVKGDGGGICGHGAGAPASRAGHVPARGPVLAVWRIRLLP
jgi:hypothetical protein